MSQSSQSSSKKHSNLLAAKSALGLVDANEAQPSSTTSSRISSNTSTQSRGSTISGTTYTWRSADTGASGNTGTTSLATSGAREKRSTLHDLSSAARLEARRISGDNGLNLGDMRSRLRTARTSINSEERFRQISTAVPTSPLSPGSPLRSTARQDSGGTSVASSAGDTWTLEEGSRDDSMAAWTKNSHDSKSRVGVQSEPNTHSQMSSNSRDSSNESTLTHQVKMGDSEESGMSSSNNFGMSSSFNVYEKKVSFTERNRQANRVLDSVQEDFQDSDTFGDNNTYDETNTYDSSKFHQKKVSFNEDQYESRIIGESERFEESDRKVYDDSEASSQLDESYNRQLQDHDASYRSLASTGSNFVPQKFEEMRYLLLNTTPLQLEALVHEMYTTSPSLSANSDSANSRVVPKEWRNIKKKSKRYRFRKDAYLSEMNFEELQNFAQSIELWSIVDNEGCADYEEAMDIFAIEFEMLVSGFKHAGSVNSMSQNQRQVEDDIQSYISSNSIDEGENLKQSLRACSLSELRLVAERLHLNISHCADDKTELIFLIESSMPSMLNNSNRSENSMPSMLNNSNRSENSIRSNPPPPPPRGYSGNDAAMYVEESHAQQQEDEQEKARRVMFSPDCKEDTSHLIPKREINQSLWSNYVVDGLNDIEHNGEDSDPLMFDVEYDENGHPNTKQGRKWPEQRKRFIIVGSFVSVLIGIALGLGLGLTKDKWQGGGDDSPSYSDILTGPWSTGYGTVLETSDLPSASPTNLDEAVVILNATKKTEAPSKKPTNAPTAKPTTETLIPTQPLIVTESYDSAGVSSVEIMSNSPTVDVDNSGEDFAIPLSTSNPTVTRIISTNAPSDAPISTLPTTQPTITATESLYPLLGPFEETGMRMVLHGISELSSMGETQWKMLTSAFMEQFYNHGEKGDGKSNNFFMSDSLGIYLKPDNHDMFCVTIDAIQNIVFGVSAAIQITDNEQVTASGERRLQSAMVITFTTTISYHTYSAFLDTATVVDRPFVDEDMRSTYIDYLMTNNGVTYIGEVESISEIFRGDEVPTEFLPVASDEVQFIETAVPSASKDTPVPSPGPSIQLTSVLTPRPTLPTDLEMTPRPTFNSFDFDFVGRTLAPMASPNGNAATQTLSPVDGGSVDTPFPTSSAFGWPDETPAPSPIFGEQQNTRTPAPSPIFGGTVSDSPNIVSDSPTTSILTLDPTPVPIMNPSSSPSTSPTSRPSSSSPSKQPSKSPSLHPTATPASSPVSCDLVLDESCSDMVEVRWTGFFEVAQTHVVKATAENRRAPRMIANREIELLFTPAKTRWLTSDNSGAERAFTPSETTSVRLAMYSTSGQLLGVTDCRSPSNQRAIFESQVSQTPIDPYTDSAWSATLPFNWIEEGNTMIIGCIDPSRPTEFLSNQLVLKDLAQFSEHSVTRTKIAIFGSEEDVSRLNHQTFDSKKLARNLYAVMPVAELKFADTELWHLPYLVVTGKDGTPTLVSSEKERREVTGIGTEIQWEVMKNSLTIRHALAQAGLGFALTSQEGDNSPYASHTSVFMGWSLSKQEEEDGPWQWEDLGYWDTLAAAAWVGWIVMKAGDECSNYFIHEMGHSQSMQHFDNGVAFDWKIEDEYPSGDGIYTPDLPWGYDSVLRQFRTWFDPLDGSGKKDPLNGEGEPPYSQELNCFSQYTPYQAQVSQEWAMSTPLLLSSSSSDVPIDGAYKFNSTIKQYVPLVGQGLTNAVGQYAMLPDQVSIPVVTLIGTIGATRDVCQTYPALRGYGNTFKLPEPFEPGLPSAFDGSKYFVEVRFYSGRKIRGLIAVKDVSVLSQYSFNIAIDQIPIAVDLYRFVDGAYPNLTSQTEIQLLHIRPIELHPEDPLRGMQRQLRVGRGWLGDSSTPLLDRFCISSADCESEKHNVEWRGTVGSDHLIYRSTLQGTNDNELKATIFKVPALRQKDSTEYTITVLAARFFNDRQGISPLLTSKPITGVGSSSIDVTHVIRIWAPWELNEELPVGVYRSLVDSFKISADTLASGGNTFQHNIIELNVLCYIGTVTASPTFAPTRRPSEGPSRHPVEVHYHIDWKHGTCLTEGDSSSWAPPYKTKEECCEAHMGYEYNVCLSREV